MTIHSQPLFNWNPTKYLDHMYQMLKVMKLLSTPQLIADQPFQLMKRKLTLSPNLRHKINSEQYAIDTVPHDFVIDRLNSWLKNVFDPI